MAVNFSALVYLPNFDMWARPIVVTPFGSQPGQPAYTVRGIFDTRPIDVQAEDGSIYCEQQTILDVRDDEFSVVPTQSDHIHIPSDFDAGSDLGDYEVIATEINGGGETTLVIRKLISARPAN
jgi:hypothetical protein